MIKRCANLSLTYGVIAMAFGVFYREFTKFRSFTGRTSLSFLHTHYFMLGMFFFLLLMLAEKAFSFSTPKTGRVLAAYQAVCGKQGTIEATHGGLECGLFVEKLPGLDAVSFGPELHDVHSVQERLSVASTQRVYEVTRELLKRESAVRE